MTKKTLSGWWAGSSHRALGATQDKATRLALALTPVRSVMRVIDDHIPPMTVEWAAVHDGKSISATDFSANRVVINPLPILEEKITTAAALDVVTGFAMHESSHGKHSRDRYKYLIKVERYRVGGSWREKEVPAFRPLRIAAYLWNLVEDVRIEQATTRQWPGAGPYFDAVLGYMWGNIESAAATDVDKDNPHPALTRTLQTVYMACRYPTQVGTAVDPSEWEEVKWWQAWQGDYLTEQTDTPTTIQRGLDHLKLDEDVAEEMQKMEDKEKAEEKAGEKARAQLERLMKEGVEGSFMVCINEDGEVEVLDEATAEKVEQLVREGLIEVRPTVFANGASNPPHRIRKPEETAASRRAYIGRPNAESAALRAALVFRPSAPQFDVKLLRQGVMDDEELYRWGMGDYRVFSERVIESKPDVFMGLLVDMSGSMSGSKLRTAQKLAQLFVWALHDQEGVDTRVWGHTGDGSEGASVEIFRLWEHGDPMSRLGLIDTLPHMNNYDGHANAYCIKQILQQPHPQKVLIVLSDGLPSGQGYGGERGMKHMREVNEWARRQGCEVYQIAIDTNLDMEDQARMYGAENVVPYKSVSALPRQLARIMARFH